ncbi:MAG TPA: hypothetical protein VHD90_14630 [Phototrophicaceae bacterium]|nr:hypothetical protein [Phototrophicaceae bacterium]
MATVRLSALVTEDHELSGKVPENIPPGRVELVIELPETVTAPTSAREAARAKLAAAGLLSTAHHLPPGTRIPTDAEVDAAGILPPGARPSEELVDEDRNER